MTSRRKWELGVCAAWSLCCALFFCAAAARADSPAETEFVTEHPPAVTTPSSTDSLRADAGSEKAEAEPTSEPDIPSSDALKQRSSGIEKHRIDDDKSNPKSAGDFNWLSLVAPLVVVLVVIVLVFWAVRKYVPGMRRLAGSDVVRVLARTYLSPRQSVTLIKVGRRILVVGQSADRLSALGEVSDEQEVSELLGLCRSEGDGSLSRSFQKVFQDVDREFDESDGAPAEESGEQLGRVRSQLDNLARKVREVAGLKR